MKLPKSTIVTRRRFLVLPFISSFNRKGNIMVASLENIMDAYVARYDGEYHWATSEEAEISRKEVQNTISLLLKSESMENFLRNNPQASPEEIFEKANEVSENFN